MLRESVALWRSHALCLGIQEACLCDSGLMHSVSASLQAACHAVMLKGCHSNWFELRCAKGGFCYVKLLCTVAPHALCLGLQEACLVQHWN